MSKSARADLLLGTTLTNTSRRGKQLALHCDTGRVVVIHLGMSGSLAFSPATNTKPRESHTHIVWSLADVATSEAVGELRFRDPRRFGKVRCCENLQVVENTLWAKVGPDALTITDDHLNAACGASARAIKAALLDQRVLAGVGNIYADESLYRAGIHPARVCKSLSHPDMVRLAASVHAVLADAVALGGTTLRDYANADGQRGDAGASLRAYGRAGQACLSCGATLRSGTIAQRTTVWCDHCQPALR